jgi:cellobiose phosphorylase
MRCGQFDDAAREYVITDACTPTKWINYVGTLAFGGFVDHTGGALICKGDPAVNRITRYIGLQPAGDFKGTTLYLRIREKRRWKILSPFFVPGLAPLDSYECHVGLGYSRIISKIEGIRTDATFFVPPGDDRLIIDVRISNIGRIAREVDAIPVVEYSHFDALKQLTNAEWVPQTMQSKAILVDEGRRVLFQYAFMRRDTCVNFMSSSLPSSSFETERKRFLGRNEYGTWACPCSLEEEELGCHEALRGDNIGALLHHLGRVMPGEERRLIVQLGQAESREAAMQGIRSAWDGPSVDSAFSRLSASWGARLSRLQVKTPDEATDRMLNIHNPRQCHTTFNWSRYLSLYQTGYGARGIGFRDSSQDVMGVLASAQEEAKALLRTLLSVQKSEGYAMHQLNPATMEASMGDAMERDDRPHYYSDDHLWSILAVAELVKETGDRSILEESIVFYDKDRSGRPVEAATVLEHLRRGIEFTRGNVGKHGFPLLGFADWNDTVNLPAGAESLFTANLYGRALQEMAALARWLGDGAGAGRYDEYHAEMKTRFLEHAWDGEWWIRYFDWDGAPLGSHTNEKGQIYINAQSWPVLSGFATGERARTALESLRRLLNTRNGIKISAPSFNGYDPRKGGITTFPPGAKENSGIFLHTNPWVIIAETMLGNGDRAYEYYRQMDPGERNDRIEEYECEPYVYPQNILSDEHPLFGLARNSWLSGTASWAYQAATRHILGLLPTYGGLVVEPCIPSPWDGFKAVREFRGAVYQIEVRNPAHVCRGVASVSVDGRKNEGTLLPVFTDGRRHRVEVTLG